ncbi:sporulation histidine kinase inhibitor Sda [Paenibacillus validus]|uniref:Sporulation histidine kinase inhibitor Sda n=1 Tax=Paenibacillus validus TaxID=44253 RepID=A0A7X3CTI9_9BACL|nr:MULTISPECIES: sporulation histidine kinase inhibitor Sda [Paenibacillus]MED4603017.1 sporulation histidine kinase inhibitor Sda [Paenibacillus validus]MED4607531.1 sporulation histidine kinase inhibitor Sda [Paenibacillus validus]MUG71079.1 sporulation histidine kinase inhibitor Sda [Paenibacillus validus]
MKLISNEILVDSYFKALDLKLEKEFVELLLEEIHRRELNLDYYREGDAQVS